MYSAPSTLTNTDVRVAAMYKLVFGEEWLEASVSSVIDHVQWLCFVVSDRTWSDQSIAGDQEQILALLSELNKRHPGRIFVLQGSWSQQLQHVRDGLDFTRRCCPQATHALYIDSDEIYPEGQLKKLIRYASHQKFANKALHVSWHTFFKSIHFRVDPIDPYRPLALFPLIPNAEFTDFREVNLDSVEVPVRICHFSYVRMFNDRIRTKLESFRDDEAVIDDWYDKIWQSWNSRMRDFHPVKPRHFHALVYVSDRELPKSIVERYASLSEHNMVEPGDKLTTSTWSDVHGSELSLVFVVVTHNSSAHLKECLTAVAKTDHHGVVVVDNGSSDDSVAIAKQCSAYVVKLESNLGFGRAANLGAAISHGDVLCFLNPDCFINNDTVMDALAVIGNMDKCCAVPDVMEGTRLVKGKQPGYTRLKLTADMLEPYSRFDSMRQSLKCHPDYHDRTWYWPFGACFFVLRENFLTLGGFDEKYFMYMEDVDLGRRLYGSGFSIVGLNRVVEHLAQAGSNLDADQRRQLLDKARLQYADRNYGKHMVNAMRSLLDSSNKIPVLPENT